ncbi:hypothetical protein [Roseibium salinum]|uniref:Integral membrane protein n=1 Tax=Roseibium salinum TaxID=1604349 RepID=A0ABT3QYX6_9HYPH|nr:hypothetical protein [Roseibium sp. DSM 29163]MCX2722149.1 hypothetical protein [Roseibium sp. DSM 29163]MDN3719840.1 hypothetical protein [Roseibium salinum]
MPSLKSVLALDALTCAVMGVALMAGAPLLETLTAIPAGLSFAAGVLLIPVAAFMAVVAARFTAEPRAVWLVIAGNGGWVAASLVLVGAELIQPNAFGVAFILVQAAAVTALALMEFGALRANRQQSLA